MSTSYRVMLIKTIENTNNKYLNTHDICFFLLPKIAGTIKESEQVGIQILLVVWQFF